MSVLASQIVLALLLLAGLAVFLIATIVTVRRRPTDFLSPAALDRVRRQAYDLNDREGESL